jgi:hypothetical protein
MLEKILDTYVVPLDPQLAVRQRAFIEEQIQDLNIDLNKLENVFAYLQQHEFLTLENITLLLSDEDCLFSVYNAHYLYEKNYLLQNDANNQYHTYLNLVFSKSKVAVRIISIGIHLVTLQLCSSTAMNTLMSMQNHAEALILCDTHFENIHRDQYLPLMYRTFDLYRVTYSLDEENELTLLFTFLNYYKILTIRNVNTIYPFLSIIAAPLRTMPELTDPQETLDFLIKHSEHAIDLINLAKGGQQSPRLPVLNLMKKLSNEFPQAELTSTFPPLRTAIQHFKSRNQIIDCFKAATPEMYQGIQHIILFENPTNLFFINKIIQFIQLKALKPCEAYMHLIIFSFLEDKQCYHAKGPLLDVPDIETLAHYEQDETDFMMGAIYSGQCPGYEKNTDLNLACKYYQKITTDSNWFILAQKKINEIMPSNSSKTILPQLKEKQGNTKSVRFNIAADNQDNTFSLSN